jgi:hypothetical protein
MTSTKLLSDLRSLFAPLAVACLLAAPAPALATHPWERWEEFGIDPNVSYDGIRIMTMEQGEFEITERKAPQKMYTEFNMGAVSGAFILREDLDKAYMLMTSMGMYREMSLSDGEYEAGGGMEFSDIEAAGEEIVNGHPSTKYKARFEDKEGKGAGFIWITDSGVPIKMDMIYSSRGEKGMRLASELVELNLRPQDPAAFELPAGLSPMGAKGILGSVFGKQGLAGAAPVTPTAPAAAAGGATSRSGPSSADLTTDNLTQSVQNHLQALGYSVGNTHGDLDTNTVIAISQFQAENGMEATGEVSPQLLGILGARVDSR